MEYVNFGKAGVKVSPLALGLGLRGQSDESAAQRLIEHAIDSGINLIVPISTVRWMIAPTLVVQRLFSVERLKGNGMMW